MSRVELPSGSSPARRSPDSDAAFELLQERAAACGRICIVADGNFGRYTLGDAFHAKPLNVAIPGVNGIYNDRDPRVRGDASCACWHPSRVR